MTVLLEGRDRKAILTFGKSEFEKPDGWLDVVSATGISVSEDWDILGQGIWWRLR